MGRHGRLGALRLAAEAGLQHVSRDLEIFPTPEDVRLQMRTLGPFIPRIDEDDAVCPRGTALPLHCLVQPLPVALWRRTMQDQCFTVLSSWSVVPGGRHAWVPLPVNLGTVEIR